MRRILALLPVALFAVLASSGCVSNDWNAFGFDHRHFSKQPNESALNATTVGTLHQNFDFTASTTFTASVGLRQRRIHRRTGRIATPSTRRPEQRNAQWSYSAAARPCGNVRHHHPNAGAPTGRAATPTARARSSARSSPGFRAHTRGDIRRARYDHAPPAAAGLGARSQPRAVIGSRRSSPGRGSRRSVSSPAIAMARLYGFRAAPDATITIGSW